MKILQITDPHLYGRTDGKLRGVETDMTLHAVLDEAFAAVPDYAAVLVTGDLVQDDPTGYPRFRKIFADTRKPVLCIPGNHDIPEVMLRELACSPFQIGGSFIADNWQIIMLDSYVEGEDGGRLRQTELTRLDQALADCGAHAMLCMHHHPIDMGSLWLDSIGLANADEFWHIVDRHPHVRAVAWGHVHQDYETVRGDVRLYSTPSTGAQFVPGSHNFSIDSRPPAFRQFHLHENGDIDSRVSWIEPERIRRAAHR